MKGRAPVIPYKLLPCVKDEIVSCRGRDLRRYEPVFIDVTRNCILNTTGHDLRAEESIRTAYPVVATTATKRIPIPSFRHFAHRCAVKAFVKGCILRINTRHTYYRSE